MKFVSHVAFTVLSGYLPHVVPKILYMHWGRSKTVIGSGLFSLSKQFRISVIKENKIKENKIQAWSNFKLTKFKFDSLCTKELCGAIFSSIYGTVMLCFSPLKELATILGPMVLRGFEFQAWVFLALAKLDFESSSLSKVSLIWKQF